MSRTAKAQENYKSHSLNIILERIRQKHIDIIPVILEELENILPQLIEEIVNGIYETTEVK